MSKGRANNGAHDVFLVDVGRRHDAAGVCCARQFDAVSGDAIGRGRGNGDEPGFQDNGSAASLRLWHLRPSSSRSPELRIRWDVKKWYAPH
jgi:hypothetical protein